MNFSLKKCFEQLSHLGEANTLGMNGQFSVGGGSLLLSVPPWFPAGAGSGHGDVRRKPVFIPLRGAAVRSWGRGGDKIAQFRHPATVLGTSIRQIWIQVTRILKSCLYFGSAKSIISLSRLGLQ